MSERLIELDLIAQNLEKLDHEDKMLIEEANLIERYETDNLNLSETEVMSLLSITAYMCDKYSLYEQKDDFT